MKHDALRSVRRLVLTAGLSLVAAVAEAPPASACSPGTGCNLASVLPRDGAVVPASLPTLIYRPARAGWTSPASPDGFQLLDAAGTPVAVSIEEISVGAGSYYIKPKAPLVAGAAYKVRHPQVVCVAGHGEMAPAAEQTFTTTMAVAAPTLLGTAAMTGRKLQTLTVGTHSGTCSTEITAALAHVTVQPSPELRAYLAVGTVTAYVNGQAVPMVNYVAPTASGTIEFDVYAGCVVKDPGADRGLAPGKHKLELRAHVAGETVDPLPISTDIALDCSGASDDDMVVSGGGCAVAPAGAGSAGFVGLLGIFSLVCLTRRLRCRRTRGRAYR